MTTSIHEGAVDPYGLSYVVESEDFDLSTASAGQFVVTLPNGDEKTFTATLSGAIATEVTLSYVFVAGDLDDVQGIARYYPVVMIAGPKPVYGKPRSFRIRDRRDS